MRMADGLTPDELQHMQDTILRKATEIDQGLFQ